MDHPLFSNPRIRPFGSLLLATSLLASSCVSYQPAPLDLEATVMQLQTLTLPPSTQAAGYHPGNLARFALAHHPSMAIARAELGVAVSKTDEAGQWGDIELGWGAMDALSSEWSAGHTNTENYVAGLDAMLELPRPGERNAERASAAAHHEVVRAALQAAEWKLARAVWLGCVDVRMGQAKLDQIRSGVEVTASSRAFFERALEAGTVTATEAGLARAEWLASRADEIAQQAQLAASRRSLNGLLGVPADTALVLMDTSDWGLANSAMDHETLESEALTLRPGILGAKAAYETADAELRLAISMQYPRISIGTGVALGLGILSGFHERGIATATSRRAVLAAEYSATVAQIRNEVSAAIADYRASIELHQFLKTELVPSAVQCLDKANLALESGQITPLEALSIQRTLIAAKSRLGASREQTLRHAIQLGTVTGRTLTTASTRLTEGN